MNKRKIIILIVLSFCFLAFILTRFIQISIKFKTSSSDELKLKDLIKFVKSIKVDDNGRDFLDYNIYQNMAYFDSVLVICNKSEGKIWIVNDAGKILKIVGGIGSGPGEFKAIQAFDISEDGLIYLYDLRNGRFTIYNLKGELVKTFSFLDPGLIIKQIAVDSGGKIYLHHPPSERYSYSGFITLIDDSGKIIKTFKEKLDKGYEGYFYRGFLDGDLIISSQYLIESNSFTGITAWDVKTGETIKFEKPKELLEEIPKIKSYSMRELEEAYLKSASSWGLIGNSEFIMSYYYLKNKVPKESYGYLLLYDLKGKYHGKILLDSLVVIHRGDPKYLIIVQPNVQNGIFNERIPFIFNIYEWDISKIRKLMK